jgi:hypothetical protein
MMTPETEAVARRIADEIKARTNGLAVEESHLTPGGHSTFVRARKWRDQDRSEINGMRIALSFVLGNGFDMHLTDEFIADSPTWRALLPVTR